jgi:hypothetical protein
MSQQVRSWFLLGLVSAVSLAAGYALPRPAKKGGDMLDAVAAVQRRDPLCLIAERGRPYSWVAEGGIYLSRTSKTPQDVEELVKDPASYNDGWQGVVYFKACAQRDEVIVSFLPGAGDRVLDYGGFAVYGDPELLQEVRSILAEQGFETVPQ